ncbi:MAG: deoxynucleoside kinase [Bacilli bacterium]|nr:deoxynucleoside kinase [Bacilli bacterium]
MRGKLLVIEGTDCSGKQTQTELLVKRLKEEGYKVAQFQFPNYKTATGKIVGGPYLGKAYISEGWFEEGAVNVDPKVAALYFAADRRYNLPKINELLANNDIVILDRYFTSNMGHQGSKTKTKEEREKIYKWIYDLEHGLLELPLPDHIIFLHMPYEAGLELKKARCETESLDQHELSQEHLKQAEKAYLEITEIYGWNKINCALNGKAKTKEEIHEEVYQIIKSKLK